MSHAALGSRRHDILDDTQEERRLKDRTTLLRIGVGMLLVALLSTTIAGGVIGYNHLLEEYKIPSIVFAFVMLFPVAIGIFVAPLLYLAKAMKNKQQKEPSPVLINESNSGIYSEKSQKHTYCQV